MSVVYAPRALLDIEPILAYIHEHNPQAAHTVSLAIERSVALSAQLPLTGGKTDLANNYRHPLVRFPYTIFYASMRPATVSKSCASSTARKSRTCASCRTMRPAIEPWHVVFRFGLVAPPPKIQPCTDYLRSRASVRTYLSIGHLRVTRSAAPASPGRDATRPGTRQSCRPQCHDDRRRAGT